MPHPSALARLVRLPAVLSVPGDVWVGSAWGGARRPGAVGPLALGSSLLYLGGMALNDWADRGRDARERPGRPLPAGEVTPAAALGLALALTGGALAAARGGGGARGLRAGATLAAVVWAYDLAAKTTAAGPWTMALARALDVLLGAGRARRAAPAAAVLGAHALVLTRVSAHEARGACAAPVCEALGGVAGVAGAAAALCRSAPPRAGDVALALACVGAYANAMGRAGAAALCAPGDPAPVRRLVATGVLANMPLQAALLAGRGRRAAAVALLAGWPAARWAAHRGAVA
jgi:hypothetical protein